MQPVENVATADAQIDLRDSRADHSAPPPPGFAPKVGPPQSLDTLQFYVLHLMWFDALAAAVAGGLATLIRFGERAPDIAGVPYPLLAAAFPAAWLAAMGLSGSYEREVLVAGTDEFRRVLNGSAWLVAAITITSFASHIAVSRSLIVMMLAGATLFSLMARVGARKVLHGRLRNAAATLHRVVVVGSQDECTQLDGHMRRNAHIGFAVAAHVPSEWPFEMTFPERNLEILDVVARSGADTVAVAPSSGFSPIELRNLAWGLEGTGTHLVIVPAATDLTMLRLMVRPLEGLPLLHVEEPELRGTKALLKRAIDIVASLGLIVVFSPVLVACAVLVVVGSGLPVFYKQVRIGRRGKEFVIWKFRTMVRDAEAMHQQLLAELEADPIFFKLKSDPRVTRVGAFLRRFSLDELPQLFNVLGGSMSLVGPRPQSPTEVAGYGDLARRRLLVKPGVTGLWQVSGRSQLATEEGIRLDAMYVQNWSVGLDLVLLLKTFRAVATGSGAF